MAILKEGGIRDINKLSKRYDKAKIYFHQDLDGVTTALAMKNYLEDNGIEVVDSEIIQYGDKEFAIKKTDAEGDVMPVLVDFAHGKPMFIIHTDHHDSQAGADETGATSFRQSRSNVETISQVLSSKDIFPNEDIKLISTVDSADYSRNDIDVDKVINYLFKIDTNLPVFKNRMLLGLVINKLLLAFKNKPGFLEELVMTSTPSLMNILQNIKRIMKEKKFPDVNTLQKNAEGYVEQMKTSPNVKVDDGIIVQYGGGSMFKPGSYDRYTPFKNNPDADFIVIAWPLGLVQSSCNPFKKERELKGVNLGEIAQEVLSRWESQLKEKEIPLSTIKWVSESGKGFGPESVGFTFKDFVALYGKNYKDKKEGRKDLLNIGEMMETPFEDLSEEERLFLDDISVNAWDFIQAGSGGHKCITNIAGLNYMGKRTRPPQGKYKYNKDSGDAPYIKFTKMIQQEFVKKLKEKIKESKNIDESYVTQIFKLIESKKKAEIVEPNSVNFINDLEKISGEVKQDDSKSMSFKKSVEIFQIALELLGYPLPNHGVDGLFGPETAEALNKFKKDNDIDLSDSKISIFDTKTKDVMVEKIKKLNITDEDIKKYTTSSKLFTSLDGKITHTYSGKAAKNIQLLIDKMIEHGVTDVASQMGMLAVIGKETHFINKKERGYQNTSNSRINKIFSRTRKLSNSELNNLKKDYNKFFDFVYNGRIGNNNVNDGSKYVGRGFNQLTGKANYEKYGSQVGIDLVSNPDVLLDDDVAAEVAVKFLTKKGSKKFTDPNDATQYYADINSGSPKKRARQSSMEELQKFDLV